MLAATSRLNIAPAPTPYADFRYVPHASAQPTLIALPDGNTFVTNGYKTQWLLKDWHKDWHRRKDAVLLQSRVPHHLALLFIQKTEPNIVAALNAVSNILNTSYI